MNFNQLCCSAAESCPNLSYPMDCMQHTRLPCPPLSPGVCLGSCPLSQWCHPNISSSATLFSSCLQSFPASGSFLMSWFFTSGGQSNETSALASALSMNIQGWFPFGLTSLISCTTRDSRESSPAPQFESIISLAFNLLYGPTLTSIYDYWKNHRFDYMDICRQNDVSAF